MARAVAVNVSMPVLVVALCVPCRRPERVPVDLWIRLYGQVECPQCGQPMQHVTAPAEPPQELPGP
jgi:hypothetical protein